MSRLEALFRPGSVAVIGASPKEGKLGHILMLNMVKCGYPGKLYPVNPGAAEVLGFPAFPSIEQVPGMVDLAVIVIPAAAVVDEARRCAQKGVKNLVVISAGFKEAGSEGRKREKELIEICRCYGMGLVGPNCLGIIDTHTPLNATFAPLMPRPGNIALISQSGALGSAILDWSQLTGMGFSRFVSLGNKAGLNEVDFIADAAADTRTSVILGYLENITDGERFVAEATRVTREKPLVMIKSGVSQAGSRAASSHTGALAGSDLAYDTAFRQSGVLRARTMEEFFDLGLAFSTQPLPRGNRVAIVTNAGGPGILASDAVEAGFLEMARFSRETLEELRRELPVEAGLYNPVDILGDADENRYRIALERVAADSQVDGLVVLLTPQAGTRSKATAEVVLDCFRRYSNKPITAAFMGGAIVEEGVEALKQGGIPCYFDPERAVAALKGLARYARRRREPVSRSGQLEFQDLHPERVRSTIQQVRNDRRLVMLASEAAAVVEAYGVPSVPRRLTGDPDQAVAASEAIGYPVVLKISSPQIVHKTDVGGVRIGLKSAAEVRKNYLDIVENAQRLMPGADIYGIDVERMMPAGTEVIIGLTRDTQFGPLLLFGLGGIYINLIKDVSFRLARGLSRRRAMEMITETKAYTLLRGYRGEPRRDMRALVDVLCRVARLAVDFPEIVEMDINPLFVYEHGLCALDVKITIE